MNLRGEKPGNRRASPFAFPEVKCFEDFAASEVEKWDF
jgi:hypothetical protein